MGVNKKGDFMLNPYSLKLRTNNSGINVTVDMFDCGYCHVLIPNGACCPAVYDFLLCADRRDCNTYVITSDEELFDYCVGEDDKVDILKADDVTSAAFIMGGINAMVQGRYDMLKRACMKNINVYNLNVKESDKVSPVIICWMEADKYLKDIDNAGQMLINILKLSRAVGVSLILHSRNPNTLKDILGNDPYAQFLKINVFEDKACPVEPLWE